MSSSSKRARELARREAAAAAAKQRRQRRLALLAALVALVLLVGGGIAFQAWRTQRAPSAVPTTANPSLTPATITKGKPILLGSADAPVKVSLYEDFHCPHCAEFEEEYGPVLTAAQDGGKAVLELYPMSFIDSGSAAAANAMACAAEAGFGSAYYRGLFANATLQWNDDQLIALAEQVTPAPSDTFQACVTGRAHTAWVNSINATAEANGVSSTPTIFLNGAQLDLGSLTPEALQTKIDEAATT
jgi:protein-disulfide isomerase